MSVYFEGKTKTDIRLNYQLAYRKRLEQSVLREMKREREVLKNKSLSLSLSLTSCRDTISNTETIKQLPVHIYKVYDCYRHQHHHHR